MRGTAICPQESSCLPSARLAYLSVALALPGSALGLLWPSMRLTFGAPVEALGILILA
jgi:hypothetical protein